MGARKKALFVLFSFLSYCINSLTVSQHLVHAALRIFPPHTSIDIIISFFMVSVDGKETASIAVKGPHVSLCRLAKPAAKGWATPHAKSNIARGHEGQLYI